MAKKSKSKKSKSKGVKVTTYDASLPEENYIPEHGLSDFIWMIHGEPKIGKSTFISEFPNVFCMFFEPGGKSISVRQKYIPDWKAALKVLDELEANPDYCDIISIDTGFMAYERCFQFVLNKFGYEKASDGEWGDVWSAARTEFEDFHKRIFAMNKGFIVTAHSELVTIKKRNGLEHTKVKTQLGKQAWKFYNGIADIIGYYDYDDNGGRVMTIRGDAEVEAGCRMTNQFKYPDGSDIVSIPMGNNEHEAFENVKAAFNNSLSKKGARLDKDKKTKTKTKSESNKKSKTKFKKRS